MNVRRMPSAPPNSPASNATLSRGAAWPDSDASVVVQSSWANTTPESGSKTRVLARMTATPNVNGEKDDETIKRLEGVGEWPPDGLAFHVAFTSDDRFRVSEVWDSREQFDAFGERLMPVLKDVGLELSGEPEMLEVHNIIQR